MTWIQMILQILNNVTSLLDRETQADEKFKDMNVKDIKKLRAAVLCARQIFDGKSGIKTEFKGLDVLLKDKLDPKDYEIYLSLRKKFNKYS